MAKETRAYWKMREDSEIAVHRMARGRYRISHRSGVWIVWRGMNGRWYGECSSHPSKMIDAPTFTVAKYDLRKGYYVKCASAGA
jgi:hypothetical protein